MIVLVGSRLRNEGNFAASYAFNPSAAVTAGNTLVIGCISSQNITITSITDSKGNVYAVDVTRNEPSNNMTGFIAHGDIGTALTTSDTITFNLSTTAGLYAAAEEFSGLSGVDKTNSSATSFGTSHTSGQTATTIQADELLFGCHAYNAGGAWTPDGAWIELFDAAIFSASRRGVTQYQIVASAGAYESNGTTTSSDNTASLIATYRGASSAIPPITMPTQVASW